MEDPLTGGRQRVLLATVSPVQILDGHGHPPQDRDYEPLLLWEQFDGGFHGT